MDKKSRYYTLEEFANDVRAAGRYAFTLEEAKESLELSAKALNQALFRLKKKNKLAKIRKSFFPDFRIHNSLLNDIQNKLGEAYSDAYYETVASSI